MQIKRHLPPFIRDVTLEDFQAVSGLTYIPQSGVINNKDPWNRFSVLSPSQVFSLIVRELPGVPQVSFSLDDSGALMVDLSEADDMYYDGRQVDLSDGTLDHGDVEVKSNKRNGIGKKLVRNYIEFGLHLNCHGLNVLAGNTDGAYFWARIGIPLKRDLSKYDSLRQRLDKRLEAIKNSVEPELYHQAMKLIGLNNIYDINKIARLNNEIK